MPVGIIALQSKTNLTNVTKTDKLYNERNNANDKNILKFSERHILMMSNNDQVPEGIIRYRVKTGDTPGVTDTLSLTETDVLTGNSAIIATKHYVDTIASGLDIKQSVKCATTTPVDFNNNELQNGIVIDNYTLVTGDRVLVKDQTNRKQNGIYTINASGSPTRALDFITNIAVAGSDGQTTVPLTQNAFTFIENGQLFENTGWTLHLQTTVLQNGNVTIDDTNGDDIEFTQFSGAGLLNARDGMTKDGNILDVDRNLQIRGGVINSTPIGVVSNTGYDNSNSTDAAAIPAAAAFTTCVVNSTLDVIGITTLNSTTNIIGLLNANGGIACDTNKFTVADTTGNTVIDGTLTLDKHFDANNTADIADTLTLSKASGTGLSVISNTLIGGTCNVTKTLTVDGNAKFLVDPDENGRTTLASRLRLWGSYNTNNSQIIGLSGDLYLDCDAGNLILDGHTGVQIDSTSSGNVEINSVAKIVIGNDDVDKNIEIGSDGERTILIGTSSGTGNVPSTAINLNAININCDSTNGISLDSETNSNFIVDGSNQSLFLKTIGGGASQKIHIVSQGTNTDAIDIDVITGGFDLDASKITLDSTTDSNFTVTGSNQTLTLKATGGGTNQIITQSEGSTNDALLFLTNSGGITSTCNNDKSIILQNAATTTYIKLNSNSTTPANETIQLVNNSGTDNSSILLDSKSGGITAKITDGKDLTLGNSNLDAYFKIAAHSNAANEDIRIINTNGTDSKAIELTANSGGITATCDDNKSIILINEAEDTYIKLNCNDNSASSETIQLFNNHGNTNTAISLTAYSGGITAICNDNKSIILGNASIDTYIKLDCNNSVASNETIHLVNADGISESAIAIISTSGGVDIDAAANKDVNIAGGQLTLLSKTDEINAISLTTDVGSTETIVITNTQGTNNSAIWMNAIAGGIDIDAEISIKLNSKYDSNFSVNGNGSNLTLETLGGNNNQFIINSSGNTSTAIDINSLAGGIDINSATSTEMNSGSFFDIQSVGNLTLDSSTGNINIGTDNNNGAINIGTNDDARIITIGNVTDASEININSGTGGINLASTGTGDITINSDDTLIIDSDGILELNSSQGVINIGNDNVNQNINLGTQGNRVISIGNNYPISGLELKSGSGNMNFLTSNGHIVMNSNLTFLIDSTQKLELNSSSGPINIGNDAIIQPINIGTGASSRTITIGNVTGATQIDINSGTGGINLASTGSGDITINSDDTLIIDSDGILELNSSAGIINIGNDDVAQPINIGTGSSSRTITIGNVTDTSEININSGTGGINLVSTGTGDITINSDDTLIIDSDGILELNSSDGAINIGNDAITQPINIGTGASSRTITIGNDASTKIDLNSLIIELDSSGTIITDSVSSTSMTSGTTFDIQSTSHLTIDSSGGNIGLGTDNNTGNINIGTNAAARTITLGNSASTSVNLNALAINLTSVNATTITDGDATLNFNGSGASTLTTTTYDHNASGLITIDTTDTTNGIKIGTVEQGVPIQIGHTTSEVTINDNLTITGNLTVNGTRNITNSTVVHIDDPVYTIGGTTAIVNGTITNSTNVTLLNSNTSIQVGDNVHGNGINNNITTITSINDVNIVLSHSHTIINATLLTFVSKDDAKDRGIEFIHYDTSGKLGFMGYDASLKLFTLIPHATNNNEVFSGSIGDALFKTIYLYDKGNETISGDGTDMSISSSGEISLNSNTLKTTTNNVFDINCNNFDLDASVGPIQMDTPGNIEINSSSGDINIDAAPAKDVNITGGQLTLSSKTDEANAISLTTNVGTSETIVITNTQGTNQSSIQLNASSGGIDIDAAPGKDVNISGGQLILASKTDEVNAIKLITNIGTNETISIYNTQGTGNDAINIYSNSGGIDLRVADEKNLVLGNANQDAYFIVAASATPGNEDLRIINTNGTDESAIQLNSLAGGVDIDAAAGKDVNISGGQLTFSSKTDEANAISLTTNVGTSETIVITNMQGTNESSIKLNASAGGIDIDAAPSKDINIAGGQLTLSSKTDEADAIKLLTNQGTSETIVITNTQGTNESSIKLNASAGGIDIDAAAGKDINIAGGQLILSSKTDEANAIKLLTNQGTSETIVITNTQGINNSAIKLNASAGGVDIDAAGIITLDSVGVLKLNSSAGTINIGNDAVTQPINIGTGASARTITIGNDASAKIDMNALIIELDSSETIITDSVSSTSMTAGTTYNVQSTNNLSLNSTSGEIILGSTTTCNIGVGTTDPTHKLHVHADDNGYYQFLIKNPGTTGCAGMKLVPKLGSTDFRVTNAGYMYLVNNKTGMTIQQDDGAHINLITSGGATGGLICIRGDHGKVGISTNNPEVALHINRTDAIKIPKGTTAERPTSVNNDHRGYIRFNTTNNQFEGFGAGPAWGSLGGVMDVDQDTKILAETSAGADNDQLIFYTGDANSATSNATQRMIIMQNGDVGIGDNFNPTSGKKLHVNGITKSIGYEGEWIGNTIATNRGGTGQTTYTDGEILIGKTNGSLAKSTITAGTNIGIANNDGAITISAIGNSDAVGEYFFWTSPPFISNNIASSSDIMNIAYQNMDEGFTVYNIQQNVTIDYILLISHDISNSSTYSVDICKGAQNNSHPDQNSIKSVTNVNGTVRIAVDSTAASGGLAFNRGDLLSIKITDPTTNGAQIGEEVIVILEGYYTNVRIGSVFDVSADRLNIHYNTGGNVGINTNTPDKTLHVVGDIKFTGNLYQNNALYNSDGVWSILNNNAHFTNDYNVGIGLSNPSVKLEISEADAATRDYLRLAHTGTNSFLALGYNGGGYIFGLDDEPLRFGTNDTERMRIAEAGNVGIGYQTGVEISNHKLSINGSLFYLAGGINGSDDRMKHNEVDITNALDTIMQLKPKKYSKTLELLDENFNGNLSNYENFQESGFIAQEVNTIDELKHCVYEGNDTQPWGINYNGIIPYNTQAIQELKDKNDDLQTKYDDLQNKYNDLLSRISALENN